MRFILLVLFISCVSLPTVHGQGLLEWEHLQGSQYADSPGNYTGTDQYPSSRLGAACWTDNDGNFWMFGGERDDVLNGWLSDLWKYDTSQTKWLLIRGTNATELPGVYEGSDPHPGARSKTLTWVDNTGKLWLFGGWGRGSTAPVVSRGILGDLWSYDIAANKWAFMGGSRIAHNYNSYDEVTRSPTHRYGSMNWVDPTGDVYLFGGNGPVVDSQNSYNPTSLNDLWKYNADSNQWTLVQPHRINHFEDSRTDRPTGRQEGLTWVDNSGKFWLFGGTYLMRKPDYWKYDPTTDQWESKGGLDYYNEKQPKFVGQYPGPTGGGISWVDKSGDFWMFSRGGRLSFNDFWQYNVSSDRWTQMISSYETYGDRGQTSGWVDNKGDLYVFGGYGTDIAGEKGHLGDFLRMKAPARIPLNPPIDLVGIGEVKKVKLIEPTTGGAITQISYTANMLNAGEGGFPATTAKLFVAGAQTLPDINSTTASVGEVQWKGVNQKPVKPQKPGKKIKPAKKKTLKVSGKLSVPGDVFNEYLYMYLDSGFAVNEEVESNNYINLGPIENWED